MEHKTKLIIAVLVFVVILWVLALTMQHKKTRSKSNFIDPKYAKIFDDSHGTITYSEFKTMVPESIDNVTFNDLKDHWILDRSQ